jgi:predicted RND superfamily exporter protein
VGRGTTRFAPLILVGAAVALVVAGYGISRIRINDNPTKWFEADHPIRVADRVLNAHFGGTYMAYLELEPAAEAEDAAAFATRVADRLRARGGELEADYPAAPKAFDELADAARGGVPLEGLPDGVRTAAPGELLARLATLAENRLDEAAGDAADAWDQAALFVGELAQERQTFKQPEVLRFVEDLQQHLLTTGVVGKSNSLPDIVKTVYRELMEGEDEYFRVPDSPAAVAQCLIQYESSHRPQDLAHFVLRDEGDPAAHFRKSVLWVQLVSGDNRDMQKVVDATARFMDESEAPVALTHRWFGLTYINVIWQDEMVRGMLTAFLGSFLVVLLMMMILFRSGLWGLLSMIPLTVTVAVIYGVVGLVGKDYDMPVAVLSALTLGLAVDYAIHFLARSRALRETHGSWKDAVPHVFGEPARAITRNVVVVGVGFLPLLAAPLVPYKTVGVFMAAILVLAGVASLLILPALVRVLRPLVFPETRACCITCNCGTCIVASATAVALVALNVGLFFAVGWTTLTWISLPAVGVLALACGLLSYREKCRRDTEKASQEGGNEQ